ncbi:MAG: hypothetical protein ACREND_15965 [Gemmatimonadaceae bacterium]
MSRTRDGSLTQAGAPAAGQLADELSQADLERVVGGLARPWDGVQPPPALRGAPESPSLPRILVA